MATRIGIDTGGTFTDVVRCTAAGLRVHKVPSTPGDPARAVLDGLARARRRPSEAVDVVHGTTVGLNAVLTSRLPRTALVTNAGFEDLVEIGRQERADLYALEPSRPEVPVPRELRFGLDCRRGPDGKVLRPLRGEPLEALCRRLVRARVEAVAVGLLHSPASPADERRIARALRRALPGVPVTCSAELLPARGEFERLCSAVLNAAIAPVVGGYTRRLRAGLGPGELRLMRSSLGIMDPREAEAFPARAMFSGPAGGVLAAESLARQLGWPSAATLDMGGTSTDVCLVRPGDLLTDQSRIAGLPLALPTVDVHTVGCGGGSIAYVDRGGALRVGPLSAGADPGPACYGVGDEPTVTDAHMVLGHMGAETLLAGEFPVDPDRSVRAVERLGKRLGLGLRRTAEGILEVAEVNMLRALLVITVQRAADPQDVPLVAFGGAGGLHAVGLGRRLRMPEAVVPWHPGAFSAVGLALAGESREILDPLQGLLDARREPSLRERARTLAERARAALPPGSGRARVRVDALLRYRGQGGSLRIPLGRRRLPAAFAAEHQRRFGFSTSAAIELVGLHVRAERPPRRLPPGGAATGGQIAARTRRPPAGGPALRVLTREDLPVGKGLSGPCLIEEPTGAVRVPQGARVLCEETGLRLRWTPGG